MPPPAAVVQLVSVSTSTKDGNDQLVITTTDGIPGWSMRYVDAVRIDDEPFPTEGSAAIELVLEAADPASMDGQGAAEQVAVHLLPTGPIIKSVDYAYYLGDQVTYALGLDHVAEYTVETTSDSLIITFLG